MTPQPGLILANGEIKDDIIARGVEMLRAGRGAEDVAEQVARDVEDDADDASVGFSGLPNILGQVELDASFMEGAGLRAGAVAGLRNFRHPISVARAIMAQLPHVLLVGAGAERFGDEIGAERRNMLTPAAHATWIARMRKLGVSDFDITELLTAESPRRDLVDLVQRAFWMRESSDTMNVIVRDPAGHIVSAVTTSGVAWKYPGRAGDSPIIGAGNYVDDRYGAAACMGLGEITIRTGAAVRAVLMMELGHGLDGAGRAVVAAMKPLLAPDQWVRVLLLDAHGNTAGYANQGGLNYKVQSTQDARPITHLVNS